MDEEKDLKELQELMEMEVAEKRFPRLCKLCEKYDVSGTKIKKNGKETFIREFDVVRDLEEAIKKRKKESEDKSIHHEDLQIKRGQFKVQKIGLIVGIFGVIGALFYYYQIISLKTLEVREVEQRIKKAEKRVTEIEKADIKKSYILGVGSLARMSKEKTARLNKALIEHAKAVIPDDAERKKFMDDFKSEYGLGEEISDLPPK